MIVRTNWDTSTNKDTLKTLVRKWFDSTDREPLVEYPTMFKTMTTNDDYERHGRYAGLDYPGELDEGENIALVVVHIIEILDSILQRRNC